MKVIKLDELLHDIKNGDAPVSGYAVVDWLKSKAFEPEFMPYLSITYSKDSIPIMVDREEIPKC